MAGGGAKFSADLGMVTLKTFEPGAGVQVVWDTKVKGFGLRTRGSTARASWRWIYKYRHLDGSQVKLTLGSPYGGMTVTEARAKAREAQGARRYADKDLRTVNARVLEEAARARRAMAEANAAEAARSTVGTLWERYWAAEGKFKKASKSYEQLWLNHLQPSFGTVKVADVTPEAVEEFKASRVGTPGACNRALAVLSVMMTKAVAWGWRRGCAPEHPVKGGHVMRYPETKVEFSFSAEELGALLREIDAYSEVAMEPVARTRRGKARGSQPRHGGKGVSLALRMLAVTGARAGEVLKAHWGQISRHTDGSLLWTVEATNTKLGRAITRALDPDLARRLLEWEPLSLALSARPEVVKLGGPRWVFPNARDPSRPVPRVENAWREVKVRAGLTREDAKAARIHDLRHTVASHILANNGGDLSAVKEQLGHATILTTQRYAHVLPHGIAKTANLMGDIAVKAQAAAGDRKSADIVPHPAMAAFV